MRITWLRSEIKKAAIERYFDNRFNQLSTFAASIVVEDASEEFVDSFAFYLAEREASSIEDTLPTVAQRQH